MKDQMVPVPELHFGPDGSLYLEPGGSSPRLKAMVPATLSESDIIAVSIQALMVPISAQNQDL